MVKVHGAYVWKSLLIASNIKVSAMQDIQTDLTYYTDPYSTHLNWNQKQSMILS